MGQIILNSSLDINDLNAVLEFDLSRWNRCSIQMIDLAPSVSTAVLEFKVGVDGVSWNSLGSAVTFTSTASTHWQTAIDVENAALGQIRPTTAEGSAGTVYFTVYGYNVED